VNNFKHKQFEEKEQQYLPPVWIDIQEDIDDNIVQLKSLIKELAPLRHQRFGNVFFDDAGARKLDNNIASLVSKIKTLIK
jgi:hypothetical protein